MKEKPLKQYNQKTVHSRETHTHTQVVNNLLYLIVQCPSSQLPSDAARPNISTSSNIRVEDATDQAVCGASSDR